MKSKIIVNVMEGGGPCINVIRTYDAPGVGEFNLADKVLQMFFEKLANESSFLGVYSDTDQGNPGNVVNTIVPLGIPDVLEWLCRFFVDNKVKTSIKEKEVMDIFSRLRDIYFDVDVLGSIPKDVV